MKEENREEEKQEEEKQEEQGESGYNNGEEVVSSVKEEVVSSVKEDAMIHIVNTDNISEYTTKDSLYEKVNEYLKTRATNNYVTDKSDSNSHYSGLHTEVMPTMPVLFIEEFIPRVYFDYKKSNPDTDWRAYVYYDSSRGVYVVNGTRRRSNEQGAGIERRFPDIRMTFKTKSSLAFYLRRSMSSCKHKLSITMYSMYRSVIHLSTCGAMPSFHSIHHCRKKFRTELFGYDDCRVSLKEFESYLKVLKDGADDGFLFRPTNSF
jgi:hypothetical protein